MMKKLLQMTMLLSLAVVYGQITIVDPEPDFTTTAEAPDGEPPFATDLFPIDLNNDGTPEYFFRWDDFQIVNHWFIHFCSNPEDNSSRQFIANGANIRPLNYGDPIGPSVAFSHPWDPFVGTSFDPNFQGLGNRYIGFKATVSGTVYYGWVLIELVNRTLTVKNMVILPMRMACLQERAARWQFPKCMKAI